MPAFVLVLVPDLLLSLLQQLLSLLVHPLIPALAQL
jgi:hypothetical protein